MTGLFLQLLTKKKMRSEKSAAAMGYHAYYHPVAGTPGKMYARHGALSIR